jgi:hypothetical protein
MPLFFSTSRQTAAILETAVIIESAVILEKIRYDFYSLVLTQLFQGDLHQRTKIQQIHGICS